MSEDEGFLRRWSRRKQAASVPSAHRDSSEHPAEEPVADGPQLDALPSEAGVDLSSLPSIDSIGADTDIRGFLQKGVPLDMTRAALRRVWSEDPAIRNFIEVAENQWDFATGADIPGFGPLDAGVDVRRMVADILGDRGAREAERAQTQALSAEEPAPQVAENAAAVEPEPLKSLPSDGEAEAETVVEGVEGAEPEDSPAEQQAHVASAPEQRPLRRHGGALPQ